MRVLLLAPHPFFQARGTPIAVDLLLRVLSSKGHEVDVVTFPEGEDRVYPNVRIHRAASSVSGVRPGFSVKKLYCDWGLYRAADRLLAEQRYDVIHATEEAVFFAARFSKRYRTPFVYDMDSLLSAQLADKSLLFALFRPLLEKIENWPLKQALAVAPMCQDLADVAARVRDPGSIFLVKDVSLIEESDTPAEEVTDLRAQVGNDKPILLYVGNLERYQGIDLVLQAMQKLCADQGSANLVLIGGAAQHIDHYRQLCQQLGISQYVFFLGPRPVDDLGADLGQADVLVSPRTHGTNTPMKIYSYLHAGVPLVATRLATHTQVLSDDIAVLAEPDPVSFAQAIAGLIDDPERSAALGRRAHEYAQREHGFPQFVTSVEKLYSFLESSLCAKK